jgi:hypothetical protein
MLKTILLLTVAALLVSCGTGEAVVASPAASKGKKIEAFQISDLGVGPFVTIRDIGTKPGQAHYVDFTFELQGYGDNPNHHNSGHIALGVGNVYEEGGNEWRAPYGEGFILGQTQVYPEVAGRCVQNGQIVNGVAFIRESYYSRSILDGLACFGPLKQNQKYRAYMEYDEKQRTHYLLYEGDQQVAKFSGTWVEMRQFERIGFFLIPLPDAGKYKLHSLKVGTIHR